MRHLAILLIKLYQFFISPMFPQACGFFPSCSQYAIEAMAKHGTLHGIWLALIRLLRCNPWSRGGIDLVPHSSKGAPP